MYDHDYYAKMDKAMVRGLKAVARSVGYGFTGLYHRQNRCSRFSAYPEQCGKHPTAPARYCPVHFCSRRRKHGT